MKLVKIFAFAIGTLMLCAPALAVPAVVVVPDTVVNDPTAPRPRPVVVVSDDVVVEDCDFAFEWQEECFEEEAPKQRTVREKVLRDRR